MRQTIAHRSKGKNGWVKVMNIDEYEDLRWTKEYCSGYMTRCNEEKATLRLTPVNGELSWILEWGGSRAVLDTKNPKKAPFKQASRTLRKLYNHYQKLASWATSYGAG